MPSPQQVWPGVQMTPRPQTGPPATADCSQGPPSGPPLDELLDVDVVPPLDVEVLAPLDDVVPLAPELADVPASAPVPGRQRPAWHVSPALQVPFVKHGCSRPPSPLTGSGSLPVHAIHTPAAITSARTPHTRYRIACESSRYRLTTRATLHVGHGAESAVGADGRELGLEDRPT